MDIKLCNQYDEGAILIVAKWINNVNENFLAA
jgi:hypothetical protein